MPESPFGDFTDVLPDADVIVQFQSLILDHYRREGRDLPWRRCADPFGILVSEIMLQQTQVPRVLGKWEEFMRRFPSIKSLAEAPLKDVLETWQGLGYNRRAKALKEIAEILHAGGQTVPREAEALVLLPMIGPATARSIATFAFNSPEVFIETNVRRVFIHFFFLGRRDVSDREIFPIHEAALYREDPRRWYNALMDYGTLLAAEAGNANHRSTEYVRQGRFEGSFRQVRGKVLKVLTSREKAGIEQLRDASGVPLDRLQECLYTLAEEGFLVREDDGTYRIS